MVNYEMHPDYDIINVMHGQWHNDSIEWILSCQQIDTIFDIFAPRGIGSLCYITVTS